MHEIVLHDAFVGQGCQDAVEPAAAVSAGAGAMWIDLYHAVTTGGGRYVQGGGCTDVGVAGLVQSGGFGSLSKTFGTAAASLVEAEVVTADGQVRIANPRTNPDLFWALKGGGGGSWGVVTRLTLRTHPLPQYFGAAWGKVQAHSDEAYRRLIARFFAFYSDALLNPQWGEQVSFAPDNTLKISMVCQGLDKEQVRAVWQPFFAWMQSAPDDYKVVDPLGAGAMPARDWWSADKNHSLVRDPRAGAPAHHAWWEGDQDQVGAYLHGYDSLWLPAALLRAEGGGRLTAAVFAASRHKELGFHMNKGLAGAPATVLAAARDTATNPAVLEAFALVIIADGEGPAYPGQPGAASTARQPARMRAPSPAPRRSCAASRRGRGPMCQRATISTSIGGAPTGASTTRGCGRSRTGTTPAACSSFTTASAARTGAPTVSRSCAEFSAGRRVRVRRRCAPRARLGSGTCRAPAQRACAARCRHRSRSSHRRECRP